MKSGASLGALRVLLAAGIICVVGCGKGSSSSSSGDITAISISPSTASVPINETEDFIATVTFTNPSATSTTNTAVTWAVNGISGGNATVGTIVNDASDAMVGIYTAPTVVPTTNNGEVTITASADRVPGSTTTASTGSTTTTTSNSTTVVSNTATVTVGGGLGLSITNTSPIVPAASSFQFLATLNGLSTNNVTWSVSSANGGQIGTIDAQSGLYTAPPFPPPGAQVTVTATANVSTGSGSNTATTTAEIVYSDHSLSGPFAFSYTGNDEDGFIAVAGSFVADGKGGIVSGVEDVESFASGVVTELQFTGNYVVGADGRTTATILSSRGTATWAFVMTTNQHASLIRFDTSFTGGGSIDAQNTNDLTNSTSVVAGPYVFTAAGTDASFNRESIAGRFTADGGGNIPQSASVIDVSDNGSLASGGSGDISLAGSYSIDTTNPGTGRGTMTLTSGTTSQLQFAFYLIDNTHLHIVEIDSHAFLAGDVLAGATGSSFSNANLAGGNYTFTAGGNSSAGAYAAGGVFTSDGSANVTGGVIDKNNAGTLTTNTSLGSCPFAVNATNSRTDLKIFAGTGACPATPNSAVSEFAAYPTAQGGLVMLEIDPAAVTTGTAFAQTSSTASFTGNFALGLFGQGVFHNSPSSTQGDLIGALMLSGTTVSSGNLNVNSFTAVFPQADPIAPSTSSLTAPGSTGRGTLVISGTDPVATYDLVYYLINGSTALVLDADKSRVATGIIANQF